MANGEETKVAVCPFAAGWVEAAKQVFLANPGWKRIYDEAPSGAKRRLEVSFWFSKNLSGRKDCHDMFEKYREWRTDVERTMTEEDIERITDCFANAAKFCKDVGATDLLFTDCVMIAAGNGCKYLEYLLPNSLNFF